MTKYQLAKLILMAGGLESRKRVQKTAYLLQAAGCRLGLDFRVHYYGPYSADLAEMLDQAAAAGILSESSRQTPVGTQYDYQFSEPFRQSLEEFERSPDGRAAKAGMEEYEGLLRKLCRTRPRILELASTIAAFHKGGRDWDGAVAETADFKNEALDSSVMTEARTLAQQIVPLDNGEH